VDDNLIRVSLLELISNSLRAHHERGATDPVIVDFICRRQSATIEVVDRGGGFVPSRLPYNLADPLDSIDLMNSTFRKYREDHDNRRFGMGLYIARKTFHSFTLGFVDSQGKTTPWFSGLVAGTRVELGIDYRRPAEGKPNER